MYVRSLFKCHKDMPVLHYRSYTERTLRYIKLIYHSSISSICLSFESMVQKQGLTTTHQNSYTATYSNSSFVFCS